MHMVLDGGFCFSEAPWLSWSEIKYGLDRGFLTPLGVVEYAVKSLSAESSAEQYELACLSGDDADDVRDCVDRIAVRDVQCDRCSEEVWVFLVLLWVLVNRDRYQDPLGVVEGVYADFDYPESVAPIFRYMPAVESDLEGDDQLYRKWSSMLELSRLKLQAGRSI
ncbi:DUF2247 family protein [Pseudomonas guariconensis]|uniref:DUF2247 family protein n=1 Tax=Pseudomonas guariconensis TaxID=1288410 RepID=UPI00384EDDB6